MRWSLLIVLFLGGCAVSGICDYNLAAKGWYPVVAPPSELQYQRIEGTQWFTNDQGDFFACHELKRRGVCGSTYRVYARDGKGGYKEQEIVCTK